MTRISLAVIASHLLVAWQSRVLDGTIRLQPRIATAKRPHNDDDGAKCDSSGPTPPFGSLHRLKEAASTYATLMANVDFDRLNAAVLRVAGEFAQRFAADVIGIAACQRDWVLGGFARHLLLSTERCSLVAH